MATPPTLIILTTHFGTNFSGGSNATCEIFKRIQTQFNRIIVVGTELGQHPFNNLTFKPYRNILHAVRILKSIKIHNSCFYGDFYNSYLFSCLKIPFYFTYHDNWPELQEISPNLRIRGLFFWSAYRLIFRSAQHVFVVSNLKLKQIKKFNSNISLARNGYRSPMPLPYKLVRSNVVMVGNIDERKYRLALRLFEKLEMEPGFQIDIYGRHINQEIVSRLDRFPFVKLMSFQQPIPYFQYSVCLHTSQMENLSMVWCEALAQQTPVLTFSVGAADELIDTSTGILIPQYDLDSMKKSLMELTKNPMRVRSTEDKLKNFSWDAAATQYSQVMLVSSSF